MATQVNSRIGKQPIAIASGVTATLAGQEVTVKGPKGQLAFTVPEEIEVAQADGQVTLTPRVDSQRAAAMWGLSRTLVNNMVVGVTQGYEETLELVGVDKQAVGEIAAKIRRVRPPEPYKGKGVRYQGEKVRRKEGKKK